MSDTTHLSDASAVNLDEPEHSGEVVEIRNCVAETDHTEEWGDQPTIRFFPEHFMSEATAMLLVMALYTAMGIFLPAHLGTRANPMVTPIGIKPEWYFLFLFQILHWVPPLVGNLIAFAGIGFLFALPWIDRNPARALDKRKLAMALCALTVIGIVVLSIMGARPPAH